MHTTTITSVSSNTQTWPVVSSKSMRRIGYSLSSLAVLFLLIDSVIKLLALPIVLETSTQLGYQGTPGLARTLGVILFIFAVLYVYPRTSILGAVLLTAFLEVPSQPTSAWKVRS